NDNDNGKDEDCNLVEPVISEFTHGKKKSEPPSSEIVEKGIILEECSWNILHQYDEKNDVVFQQELEMKSKIGNKVYEIEEKCVLDDSPKSKDTESNEANTKNKEKIKKEEKKEEEEEEDEENLELWRGIMKDVNRTLQYREFFRKYSTKYSLGNVLYIWAKSRGGKRGYLQGMNELAAVILCALSYDYIQIMEGDNLFGQFFYFYFYFFSSFNYVHILICTFFFLIFKKKKVVTRY
ncbi:hypothetical protein RFI_29208, partial [Reticulomyxa filosa]